MKRLREQQITVQINTNIMYHIFFFSLVFVDFTLAVDIENDKTQH